MTAVGTAARTARLRVGGAWREASDGASFDVRDPATSAAIGRVADATPADAIAALDSAVATAPAWVATPPRERADLLRAWYEALVAATDELAELMTLEMGKPLAESRGEVRYGAEFVRWYAEEAVRIEGATATAADGSGEVKTVREPVGPCLLVTPWNFPLAMVTRKLAPALAAGCTAIVKPAQQTPLTALRLVRMLEQAGLPPGVVSILPTTRSADVVGALLRDRRLRKLSFTGSTAVGRTLLAGAAPNVLRVSMELGGNAPFIVLDDADVEAAVEGALVAKLRNNGEACTAANRFLVAERIEPAFSARLAERMADVRVGHGSDPATQLGPLIDAHAAEGVHALVQDAVGAGAELLTGGAPLVDLGESFYPPTVLRGAAPGARIWDEEIFGPVAPVRAVASDAEAIALANASEVGLAAYVYGGELGRALRVAGALEVGMDAVNRGTVSNPQAPFGGVKHSGLGREGGRHGIDEYLETKYLAVEA